MTKVKFIGIGQLFITSSVAYLLQVPWIDFALMIYIRMHIVKVGQRLENNFQRLKASTTNHS